MSELDKEVKEYFESGGEQAPEVKEEQAETPEPVEAKTEETPVEKSEKTEKQKQTPEEVERNKEAALREARAELKRFKKELQERDQRQQVLEQRMEEIRKAWATSQQPPVPEFEQDPANHLKYQQEQTQKELAELRAWRDAQNQQTQQTQQMQAFVNHIGKVSAPFQDATPDYQQAYNHVINAKVAELKSVGMSEDLIRANVGRWEVSFANQAIQNELNPAEQLYNYAKQIGYSQKPQGNPGLKQISTVRAGQEAAKTVTGGVSDGELTLESLAEMSPDDFSSLLNDKNWNRLMRGKSIQA